MYFLYYSEGEQALGDKTDIYENEIVPLLDQLQIICEREGIPTLIASQLAIDDETAAVKVAVQTFFNDETTKQFIIAAQVLRGQIEADEPIDNESIQEAIDAHVEVCPSCAAKVATIKQNNPEVDPQSLIGIMARQHVSKDVELENDFLVPFNKKSDTIH